MARFNFDPIPSVAPTGPAGSQNENISATPEEFGGLRARAEQTLGQGIENTAEAGFNIAAFHDKISADDQVNNYITAHNNLLYGDPSKSTTGPDGNPIPDLGYMGLEGRAALDNREDTLKALEDVRQQGRNNLSSPQAQLEYDQQTKRMYADAQVRTSAHAEQQYKSWAGDVNQTRANLALNSFVRNGFDENDARTFINYRVQQAQAKYGADPTITKAVVESANRDLLKAHTSAVAVNDPAGALKLLNDHKDVAGEDYPAMANALRTRANAQTGNEIAGDALAKGKTFAPTSSAAIQNTAARYGIDAGTLGRTVQIESGGNPRRQTGSYKGLMQLSQSEFDKYKPTPTASIWNAQDNLEAGAAKMKADGALFAANFGRQPSGFDSYMIHQQGLAGYSSHLANPEAPAWQNMLSTGEGRQKGEAWAKAAIWGNIPDQYKAGFGNVNNVTSRDFIAMWAAKYGGGAVPTFGGPQGGPSAAEAAPAPQPVAFQVPEAFGESRGNVEAANFPQPNLASAIKPNVFQHILDDPRGQGNPEAQAHAFTVAREQLNAQEIAENQSAKVRKDANDEAAGNYTTAIGDMQNASKPDWTGMDNRILHDPNLTYQTKHWLRQQVQEASGGRADRTYGPGFWDAYRQVHAPDGDPGKITDVSQLYGMVGPGKPLTIQGIDKLRTEIDGKKTPEGEAESSMKKQFFEHVARPQITFTDQDLKLRDPKGDENFLRFMAQATALYDKGKAAGLTPAQLLDPQSKDYVGKIIENFKSPPAERFVDRVEDNQPGFFSRLGSALAGGFSGASQPAFDAKSVNSLPELQAAYRDKKISAAEARTLAIARGWAKVPAAAPQVPNTQ
jgi:hypothetical protein